MSCLNIMLLFIFVFLSCQVFLHSEKVKPPASAAIPRRKNKGENVINKVLGQGLVNRLIREMKISFCSELEALTLQLTRPTDNAIAISAIEDVVTIMNTEYDNAQLVVSLLAKFSRKLSENNIFTKIKSILSIHKIADNLDDKAQNAFLQSIQSLRLEVDEKFNMPFFSLESIEDTAGKASTVAELQAVELARCYSLYVFDFVDVKCNTKSSKSNNKNNKMNQIDRVEALITTLEQGEKVAISCKAADSPLSKQCLECVLEDRAWSIKQLNKIYESDSIEDEDSLQEIEEILSKFDSKFKSLSKSASLAPIANKTSTSSVKNDPIIQTSVTTQTVTGTKEGVSSISSTTNILKDSEKIISKKSDEIALDIANRAIKNNNNESTSSSSSSSSSSLLDTKIKTKENKIDYDEKKETKIISKQINKTKSNNNNNSNNTNKAESKSNKNSNIKSNNKKTKNPLKSTSNLTSKKSKK
eukprot:gene6055-8337_t